MDISAVVAQLNDLWNTWAIRAAAVFSLILNVALMLLAGTRRHSTSTMGKISLWLTYQVQPKVGSYALGHLSLSSSSNNSNGTPPSAREQQLVAFWAPFLLIHLAGPDNITAYILEDGKISLRKTVEFLGKVGGALYVMFNYIYLCNSGVLRQASSIMIVLGVAKYFEMVVALLWSNFDNIGGFTDDSDKTHKLNTECLDVWIPRGQEEEASNEEALLYAHIQFQACGIRAMADSSVEVDSPDYATGLKIFQLEPKNLSKVAEMEASLMYDVLYTKATLVHTLQGYFLRLASPVCTTTAASLFLLYPKDCEETADVVVTYILLVAAFLLDLLWLLRALGSTWTYAYLNACKIAWLHHAFLCSGRWSRLRRFLVSLDPGRDPSSRRLWSGTIGRYNLLAESTRSTSTVGRLCSWLAKKFRVQDTWNEYRHSRCLSKIPDSVKVLLFQHIQERFSNANNEKVVPYSMKAITTYWGKEALRKKQEEEKFKGIDLEFFFDRQFQDDILIWHIGTTIFLARHEVVWGETAAGPEQVKFRKGVEVLSEYLMFLLAVRPRMLPGLELRKLFEVTSEDLKDIARRQMGAKCNPCPTAAKTRLAEIVHNQDCKNASDTIKDGIELANLLLKVKKKERSDLLELIFDVWVDKLLYAAIQCSKDYHAKQLGKGGELTTILWIVAEHAGPFQIGKMDPPKVSKNNGGNNGPNANGEEDEKKKQKKICHEDPVEPMCPDIYCMKDYSCMEDYYC